MSLAFLSTTLADLAPAIKNHLWQSTLFLALAALLTLALRRNHARTRYWLWLAASIKFLVPFSLLITLGSHLAPHRAAPPTQTTVYYAMEEVSQPFDPTPIDTPIAAPTPATPPTHILPIAIASIWLAGSLTVLALWFVYWRRITTILRNATPITTGREHNLLRTLESALPSPSALIPRPSPIHLLASSSTLGPGVYGILRPRLIWPAAISQRLDDAHLASILAHEICHVRRRDNLTAALHMLVEAIFWFHPLVWWLGTRLETERERACDESVLALTPQPRIYAESILKICEFYVESPLPCVSGVTGADLKKRLADILARHTTHKLTLAKKLLLTAAALAAITIPILSGQAKAMQRLSSFIDTSPRLASLIPKEAAKPITNSSADAIPTDPINAPDAQDTQPIPPDQQYREKIARPTMDFLINQLADAKQTLDDSDARLTEFLHQYDGKPAESYFSPISDLKSKLAANTKSIQQLEQNRSALEFAPPRQSPGAAAPSGDTLQQVNDQINLISLSIAARQTEQQQYVKEIRSYQPSSQEANKFHDLSNDFERSLHNYTSLVAKLDQVDIALAHAQANPASAPQQPAASTATSPSTESPTFDVATIKPTDTSSGVYHQVGIQVFPGGRIVSSRTNLKSLICAAFNVGYFQISGGDEWMEKKYFDIEAKPSEEWQKKITNISHSNDHIEDENIRRMLQALLIDRFQLKVHVETKTGKVYLLESTQPWKLQSTSITSTNHPGTPEGFSGSVGRAGNRFSIYNCSMRQLATFTANYILHQPVIDRTGLTGSFDHRWEMDNPDDPQGRNFDFTGNFPLFIQEMGLKLTPSTGPVETLIIDHAEEPSPN